MATTKRRSPTSTLVSKAAISSASSILEELPEKPKEIWSLREAIDLLKEPISAALDRGYSYAEVSKMLTEKGVEISPSTLKYYLSSARREKDGSKPKTRRRRKTQGITLNPETVTLSNGTANGAVASLAEEDASAKVTTAAKAKTTAKTPAKSAPAAKEKPAAAKAKTTSTKAASKTPSARGRKKAAE